MEVQRLRWKAAEKWRTEVDKKWKELESCLERRMKIGLKDGNKHEGWTRNENKEFEKFNDLTVDSFEVEVEFEECTSDSYQLEDEMQGLCEKSDVSERGRRKKV